MNATELEQAADQAIRSIQSALDADAAKFGLSTVEIRAIVCLDAVRDSIRVLVKKCGAGLEDTSAAVREEPVYVDIHARSLNASALVRVLHIS